MACVAHCFIYGNINNNFSVLVCMNCNKADADDGKKEQYKGLSCPCCKDASTKNWYFGQMNTDDKKVNVVFCKECKQVILK